MTAKIEVIYDDTLHKDQPIRMMLKYLEIEYSQREEKSTDKCIFPEVKINGVSYKNEDALMMVGMSTQYFNP